MRNVSRTANNKTRLEAYKGGGLARVAGLATSAEAIVAAARKAGLLNGQSRTIGAKLALRLVEEAKVQTGITSTTRLLEHALAKVALEDDFGMKLVARKGTIPNAIDIEL